MKKRALLLFTCMILISCSKAPGAKDTGYHGIPWGADVQTVAKKLGVAAHTTSANSLFDSHYQATIPKLGELMEKGFAKLLSGHSSVNLDSVSTLRGMTMLDQGKTGYSMFFDGKFGMNLRSIPTAEFKTDHKRFMKRYGVIDKKVDLIPDEYQSAYFIMWHDADGKILLAKEVYKASPNNEVTVCQIIHIDKHIYNELSASK